eukprot:79623_1
MSGFKQNFITNFIILIITLFCIVRQINGAIKHCTTKCSPEQQCSSTTGGDFCKVHSWNTSASSCYGCNGIWDDCCISYHGWPHWFVNVDCNDCELKLNWGLIIGVIVIFCACSTGISFAICVIVKRRRRQRAAASSPPLL